MTWAADPKYQLGVDTPFPVVTVCGSSRFRDEILAAVASLTAAGYLVISLGLFGHTDLPDLNWETDGSDLKLMLDAMHRQKITMADAVLVVDPGGYVGESTRREVEYARRLGKQVYYRSANGLGSAQSVRQVIAATYGTNGTSGTG